MTDRRRILLGVTALLLTACAESESGVVTRPTDSTTPDTSVPAETTEPAPASTAPTTAPPTAPPTTAPPSTAPATTVAPTTAPPTTAAPTTAPPLVLTDLVLRADAIGPLTFGDAPDTVIAALSGVLGAPISDAIAEYPTDEGAFWSNAVTEAGFSAPHGRDACWANGLCVFFGGSTPDALEFVGYLQDAGPGALGTRSGVTVRTRGDDIPGAVTVFEGGCFATGGGEADGVDLILISDGTPFLEFVDDTYVSNTPEPWEVEVLSLSAGEQPFFLFGDC